MMKNIIIIGLLVIIMTGATASDVVAYIENNQLIDKFSEMLYSIVRSVKENVLKHNQNRCDCCIGYNTKRLFI